MTEIKDPIRKAFAENLRQARIAEGLTQKQVAEYLGVSLRAYVGYELKGAYPRNDEIMTKIRELFGFDLLEDWHKEIEDDVIRYRYIVTVEIKSIK